MCWFQSFPEFSPFRAPRLVLSHMSLVLSHMSLHHMQPLLRGFETKDQMIELP